MARDYYAEALEFGRLLAAEGFEAWAERLQEAVAAGSTATEILMALRWHVQEVQNAALPLSRETSRRLESLLVGLEQALAG